MQHAWFLAVDFQCVVVSTIFFAIILEYPKSTLYLFGGTFAFSFVTLAVTTYLKNMEVGAIMWPEYIKRNAIDTDEYFHNHISTQANIGSFAVGLIFGCVYYHLNRAKIDLTNSKVIPILNLMLFIMIF